MMTKNFSLSPSRPLVSLSSWPPAPLKDTHWRAGCHASSVQLLLCASLAPLPLSALGFSHYWQQSIRERHSLSLNADPSREKGASASSTVP